MIGLKRDFAYEGEFHKTRLASMLFDGICLKISLSGIPKTKYLSDTEPCAGQKIAEVWGPSQTVSLGFQPHGNRRGDDLLSKNIEFFWMASSPPACMAKVIKKL
jgi:hypothetical protein